MRKFIYSIALLGLWTAGCAEADDLGGTPETPDVGVEAEAAYIPLSLISAGSMGGRANIDGYEDGDGNEAIVKDIRLYFFDTNKNAAKVRKNPAKGGNGYDSYIDYDPRIDDVHEGNKEPEITVEKTLTLMMQLNIDARNKPEYVVALINPTAELKNSENYSLDELAAIVGNFKEDGTKPFLMSNSAYADTPEESSTQENINYTKIKKLYTSREAADQEVEANRTVIFVERVAARLDLLVDESKLQSATENGYLGYKEEPDPETTVDTKNIFFTGSYYNAYNAVADKENPIFVKFCGWQVISTPKKSKLLKTIDYVTWDAEENGLFQKGDTEPWNVVAYHRSFWAINPDLTSAKNADLLESGGYKKAVDYDFYSYNEIAANKFDATNRAYIQENAADPIERKSVAENHETKVIVAAQLVDKYGDPMPIVEYGLMYYEKGALLDYFADQLSRHFYSDPSDKENSKLAKEDLEYKTQFAYTNEAGVDIEGSYLAYVALTSTAEGKIWYRDVIEKDEATQEDKKVTKKYGDAPDADGTIKDVNDFIQSVVSNRLLIWENGQTYYYLTVRHLGNLETDAATGAVKAAPGAYGVVRNHIYKVNLTALKGLGTPVLDSDEPIYPEKTIHDDYLFAAEIKVLQWRVVSQDYDFTW